MKHGWHLAEKHWIKRIFSKRFVNWKTWSFEAWRLRMRESFFFFFPLGQEEFGLINLIPRGIWIIHDKHLSWFLAIKREIRGLIKDLHEISKRWRRRGCLHRNNERLYVFLICPWCTWFSNFKNRPESENPN